MKNHNLKLKMVSGGFASALLLLMLPVAALAETVVRTGSSVSVGVNQIVENDFYAAGGSVTNSGEVREDMYVMAGSVTINGTIGKDLTVLGGTVQVHAPIGDDLRVIGGEVVVAGEVKGDVFVIGGALKVLSSATVGGDVYFYGGEAEIGGAVKGSVMGRAENFSVASKVGGGIDVVGSLTLTDGADIAGDVRYQSFSELSRSQNAVVSGTIVKGSLEENTNRNGHFSIFVTIAWFFSTLCLLFFFRPQLEQFWQKVHHAGAKSGLIGLAVLVLTPLLAVVLLLTVLGAWISVLLITAFVFLCILSLVLAPIVIGRYVMNFFRKNTDIDFLTVILGMALTFLLCYLPIIGKFIIFVTVAIILGELVLFTYRHARKMV